MSDAAEQVSNRVLSDEVAVPAIIRHNAAWFTDRVALSLLLAAVFFVPSDLRVASGKSLEFIFGFSSLIFALCSMLKRRRWRRPLTGIWLITAFVIWSTCMLAWTPYPTQGLWKVLQYWRLLPLAWLVTQYAESRDARFRLYDAYILGCWLGVAGLMYAFVSGSPYVSEGVDFNGRYSFGTDPNYLALALVMGIPFACQRAISAKSRRLRCMAAGYVPAAVLAVILTGSRGGLIALAVAACGYVIWSTGRTRLLVLTLMAALVIITFSGSFVPAERFQSIPRELGSGTLSGRRGLWSRATAVIRQSPVTGSGIGASEGILSIATHNTALEVLMAGGIVSFLLFYGPFSFGVVRLVRFRSPECKPLLLAFAVWLVGSMALSWDDNIISWFLLATLWSVPVAAQAADTASRPKRSFRSPAGRQDATVRFVHSCSENRADI